MITTNDVIHFYIGCKVFDTLLNRYGTIYSVCVDGHVELRNGKNVWQRSISKIQPVLRPITSLTDEEKVKWYGLISSAKNIRIKEKVFAVSAWVEKYLENPVLIPSEFRYLLSIGIDLFGLLDTQQNFHLIKKNNE